MTPLQKLYGTHFVENIVQHQVCCKKEMEDQKREPYRVYFTHYNCDRPFKVVVLKNRVYVYKVYRVYDNDYSSDEESVHEDPTFGYAFLTMFKRVKRHFIGGEDGNSILLDMGGHKYVFIGESIFEFKTPDDDEIEAFWSTLNGNDYAIPVALGNRCVYILNTYHKGGIQYVDRMHFPPEINWQDVHSDFYGHATHPFYGEGFQGFHEHAAMTPGFRMIHEFDSWS